MKKESNEEIKSLRRDVERSKEESRELALQAEENKQQVLTLLEQLEEIKKKQDMQVRCIGRLAECLRGNVGFPKLIF